MNIVNWLQVKMALDWLRGDRVEYRRFAAVLILKVSMGSFWPAFAHNNCMFSMFFLLIFFLIEFLWGIDGNLACENLSTYKLCELDVNLSCRFFFFLRK